jgi:hypothetical protein
MRLNALKMPLQVKLNVFSAEEQTVEFPDDATVLTVKEWVYESFGVPVEQQRVMQVTGNKILKNEVLLSTDPKTLNLKVVQQGGG